MGARALARLSPGTPRPARAGSSPTDGTIAGGESTGSVPNGVRAAAYASASGLAPAAVRATARAKARRRWRPGTTARLLTVLGLVIGLVLAAALFEVARGFTSYYQRNLTADLAEQAPEYATAASHRPASQGLEAFSRAYLRTDPLANSHLLIVGLLSQPTLGSPGSAPLAGVPEVAGWLAHPPPGSVVATVALAGGSELAMASPIRSGGHRVGVLISAAGLSHLQSQRNQVLVLAGAEAVVALLVALLGGFLVLRRVMHTVGAVTEAAAEASRGELGRRLPDEGTNDEVGRLASTFNEMLERIWVSIQSQRELLSDVSHQLRTPLTVVRGHVEVLARSGAPSQASLAETSALVVDELDRMTVLVDRLLLLGHALEPDFVEIDRVDLRALLGDVFEDAKVLADRRWSLAPVPDVVLLVDETKIRGALLNLVDNAVKATSVGDLIALRATCVGGVSLTVADSGRGIAPEDQLTVFERFRRAGSDGERGSGLGLTIVKAVAEAHGGRVELESAPSSGTAVTIVLPSSCVEPYGGPGEDQE